MKTAHIHRGRVLRTQRRRWGWRAVALLIDEAKVTRLFWVGPIRWWRRTALKDLCKEGFKHCPICKASRERREAA